VSPIKSFSSKKVLFDRRVGSNSSDYKKAFELKSAIERGGGGSQQERYFFPTSLKLIVFIEISKALYIGLEVENSGIH